MADVQVTIGGDASGAEAAAEQTAESVRGVGATVEGLIDLLLELGGAARGSFREMGIAARESGEQIKGVAEGIQEFRAGIMEFGEALIAAFAVEQIIEFAKKMGETAENIEHTAVGFGLTTGEVQKLRTQFTALGIDADKLPNMLTRIDRALGQANQGGQRQAAVFKELGINTQVARTQGELLQAVMEGFANEHVGGIEKAQQATALFGRNIAEVAPLLGLTKEQLEEVSEQADKYGTVNRDAVVQGVALAEQFNENKNAMAGFGNIMTQSLAPVMTEMVKGFNDWVASMIDSYKSGGLMKQIMDAIAATLQLVWVIIEEVGKVFASVWDAVTGDSGVANDALTVLTFTIKSLSAGIVVLGLGFRVTFDAINAGLYMLDDTFVAAGKVVRDFFTMNWGAIASDWQSGMDRIGDEAKKLADKVRKEAADANASIAKIATGNKATDKGEEEPGKSKGDAFGAKKSHDNIVQQWEDQLHRQLLAENNFFGDSKAEELTFWESKLTLTKNGSKEQMAVETKIYELRKALAQESLGEQLAELDFKKEMARDDYNTQADIEKQKLDLLKKDYGEQSRQYQDALREQQRMLEAHNQQVVAMEREKIAAQAKAAEDGAKAEQELAKIEMATKRQALDEQVKAGTMNPGQRATAEIALLQQEQAAETAASERIFQIHLNELQQELALQNLRPQERQKILDQITQLEAQHSAQQRVEAAKDAQAMQAAVNAQANAYREAWQRGLQPVQSAFDQLWSSAIKGGQTFSQTMKQMGENMALQWTKNLDTMLMKFVANQLTQTTVHATNTQAQVMTTQAGAAQQTAISGMAAMKQLMSSAATAAGNSYSAMAGIPYIGPILGAAAAVAAFAAVMAFGGSIASAEGGWGQVPTDGMMTELHKNEMVLPAEYASPLRSMLTGMNFGRVGASAGAGPAAAAAGEQLRAAGNVQFHYSPTINHHDTTWDKLVSKEGSNMRRWVGNQIRNGSIRSS